MLKKKLESKGLIHVVKRVKKYGSIEQQGMKCSVFNLGLNAGSDGDEVTAANCSRHMPQPHVVRSQSYRLSLVDAYTVAPRPTHGKIIKHC
jgi:hypothetical protein